MIGSGLFVEVSLSKALSDIQLPLGCSSCNYRWTTSAVPRFLDGWFHHKLVRLQAKLVCGPNRKLYTCIFLLMSHHGWMDGLGGFHPLRTAKPPHYQECLPDGPLRALALAGLDEARTRRVDPNKGPGTTKRRRAPWNVWGVLLPHLGLGVEAWHPVGPSVWGALWHHPHCRAVEPPELRNRWELFSAPWWSRGSQPQQFIWRPNVQYL